MQVVLKAVNSLMPYKQKSPDTTKVVTGLLNYKAYFDTGCSGVQKLHFDFRVA